MNPRISDVSDQFELSSSFCCMEEFQWYFCHINLFQLLLSVQRIFLCVSSMFWLVNRCCSVLWNYILDLQLVEELRTEYIFQYIVVVLYSIVIKFNYERFNSKMMMNYKSNSYFMRKEYLYSFSSVAVVWNRIMCPSLVLNVEYCVIW